jgi:hypothetical protein
VNGSSIVFYFFNILLILKLKVTMVSFFRGVQTLPEKPFDLKKIVALILVLSLAFAAFYLIGTSLSNQSEQPQNSDNYTVLTFALYQSVNYTQNDRTYEFRYASGGQANLLQVTSEGQTSSYSAFAGATYTPFGLKVTIFSATDSIIVLHVTPP